MTKLAPEWIRTNDPVIRSPARYRWTTAPASRVLHGVPKPLTRIVKNLRNDWGFGLGRAARWIDKEQRLSEGHSEAEIGNWTLRI